MEEAHKKTRNKTSHTQAEVPQNIEQIIIFCKVNLEIKQGLIWIKVFIVLTTVKVPVDSKGDVPLNFKRLHTILYFFPYNLISTRHHSDHATPHSASSGIST